jgi:hypothetical protein
MVRLRCRPAALLLLVLHLAGCYTWRPTSVSPREAIDQEQPRRVRVTRPDSTTVVVIAPVIVGDSIAESTEVCSRTFEGVPPRCRQTVSNVLAISEVVGLEVQRVSAARTAGLVTFAVAASAGLFLALAFATCDPSDWGC